MARYIDADLLLTDEKTHTLPIGCGKASGNVVVFVDDIEKLPTADVVPKSEIEKDSSTNRKTRNGLIRSYLQARCCDGDF